MNKKISLLLVISVMLSCVPVQANAGTLSSKLSSAISKVHEKVDSAFDKIKSKFKKSDDTAVSKSSSNETTAEAPKEKTSLLSKARSWLQNAFNMNFLSSVPVIFWKKTFDRMFDYSQSSIDNLNVEYNGEQITRDDFQDDKALHIKKSAELALHIKSLFGSSVFAYGVTLAVGGIKELIDSSFLNPNGGRCWEDFYADMVGASAVFGEKAFDKKLNKYMDSFLKTNRKVDMVDNTASSPEESTETTISEEDRMTQEYYENVIDSSTGSCENEEEISNKAQEKQRLTQEYYNAVQRGDSQAVKELSEQLRNLK